MQTLLLIGALLQTLASLRSIIPTSFIVSPDTNISLSADEESLNLIDDSSFLKDPAFPHLLSKSLSETSTLTRINFLKDGNDRVIYRKFVYYNLYFIELIIRLDLREEIEQDLRNLKGAYYKWAKYVSSTAFRVQKKNNKQKKYENESHDALLLGQLGLKSRNFSYSPMMDVYFWGNHAQNAQAEIIKKMSGENHFFYYLNTYLFRYYVFQVIDNFLNGNIICFFKHLKFGVQRMENLKNKVFTGKPLYQNRFKIDQFGVSCSHHKISLQNDNRNKDIRLTSFSTAITNAITDAISFIEIKKHQLFKTMSVYDAIQFLKKNLSLVYMPKFLRLGNVKAQNANEHYFALQYKHKKYFIRLYRNDYFHSEYIGTKISKFQNYFPFWKETNFSCLLDPFFHLYQSFLLKSPDFNRYIKTNQRGVLFCNHLKRNYILYTIKNFSIGHLKNVSFKYSFIGDDPEELFDIDEDLRIKMDDSRTTIFNQKGDVFDKSFSETDSIYIGDDSFFSEGHEKRGNSEYPGMSSRKTENSFYSGLSLQSVHDEKIFDIETKNGVVYLKNDYKEDLKKHKDQVYDWAELAKPFKSDNDPLENNEVLKSNIYRFFVDDKIGKIINKFVPLNKLFDSRYKFKIKKKILNLNYYTKWESEDLELNGFNLYEGCAKFWIRDSSSFHILICYTFYKKFLVFACDKFFSKEFTKISELDRCELGRVKVQNQWYIHYKSNIVYFNCATASYVVTLRVTSLVFTYYKESDIRHFLLDVPQGEELKKKLVSSEINYIQKDLNHRLLEEFYMKELYEKIKEFLKDASIWEAIHHLEEEFNYWYVTERRKIIDHDLEKTFGAFLLKKNHLSKSDPDPFQFFSKFDKIYRFDIKFQKKINILKINPISRLLSYSNSFYEEQYIPISEIAKMSFPDANVLNLRSSQPTTNFEIINSYSFEHNFFFGEIKNVFCSSQMKNFKLNNYGEIRSFKLDMLFQNDHFLVYSKSDIPIHSTQKINQQVFEKGKAEEEHTSKEKGNKRDKSKVEFSEIVIDRIRKSILSNFDQNKKQIKMKNKKKISLQEEGGFKPIFQSKIDYETETREGILFTIIKDNKYKVIYKNINSKFKNLKELEGCLSIVFLWINRTILCQNYSKLSLYDFSNENTEPQEVSLVINDPIGLSFQFDGKTYFLDRENKGKFNKISFYYLTITFLSVRFFDLISSNQNTLVYLWDATFNLEFKEYIIHYIYNQKLIIIFKQSIEVYFLDFIRCKHILLKKHYWTEVGIFPMADKGFKLTYELSAPGIGFDQNKSRPSIVFLAKRIPVQKVPFYNNPFYKEISTIQDQLVNVFLNRRSEFSFWKEVNKDIFENESNDHDFGMVVFDINSDSLSSFKSFVSFSNFSSSEPSNKNENENKVTNINPKDIIFFNKFLIYGRENYREKPIIGVYFLQKLQDWKDNWRENQASPGSDLNKKHDNIYSDKNSKNLDDSKYLNKYSLKILFPVEPTIKIDLYDQKHEGHTQRIIQLMGIEGQQICKNNSKNKKESSKAISEDISNQIVNVRKTVVDSVEAHYRNLKHEFAKNMVLESIRLHSFNDGVYLQKNLSFSNKLNQINYIGNIWDKSGSIVKLLNIKKIGEENTPYQIRKKIKEQILKKEWTNKQKKLVTFKRELFMCSNLNRARHHGKTWFESLDDNNVFYDRKIRRFQTNVKNKKEMLLENSLQSSYFDFIFNFWNYQANKDVKRNENKVKDSLGRVLSEEVTIQDIKILNDFLNYRNLLSKCLIKKSKLKKEVVYFISVDQLIEGNITDFDIELEYPPDNYHPPMTLRPLKHLSKQYPFDSIISSKLTDLSKSKKLTIKEGSSFDQFILITKEISVLFNQNNIKYSFPNNINLHLSKFEMNQYTYWNCKNKSIDGFSIIIRFCFEKNNLNVSDGSKRSVRFIFLDDLYVNQDDPELSKSFFALTKIVFDNFDSMDNLVYFYEEKIFTKKVLKGNYKIYKFEKIRQKKRIFIYPVEIFSTSNYFFHIKLLEDFFSVGDLLILTVPVQDKPYEFVMEIVYFIDTNFQKSKKFAKIKVTDSILTARLHSQSQVIKIDLHLLNNKDRSFAILISFPDQFVMMLKVRLSFFGTVFVDIQDTVKYNFFKTNITGVKNCHLIFNKIVNPTYLVLGSQCRDDSVISILDFGKKMKEFLLQDINFINLQFDVKFMHFQHFYENEVLLFGSLGNEDIQITARGFYLELFLVFANRAVVELFDLNLTIVLSKIPFNSNTVYLKLGNPFHSTVVPLDISKLKKNVTEGLSGVSVVSISLLFILSFFFGFGFLYVNILWTKPD